MDTSLWLIGVHLKVVFRVLVFLGNFYLAVSQISICLRSRDIPVEKNKGLEGVQ